MSQKTAIEWTGRTWNPTTGCTKVSTGCKFCYAETITQRFPNVFPNGFEFTLHPKRLDQPQRWRKPWLVFVNSMSDVFHEQMPLDFLQQIFAIVNQAPQHTFQLLTKRHERLVELSHTSTGRPISGWA
jgi:protein gp37